MNDWTGGYVTDTEYTFGHYAELNPLRARLAFLNQGLAFPRVGAACELGFGQAVSITLHAAARADVDLKVKGALGEASAEGNGNQPLFDDGVR